MAEDQDDSPLPAGGFSDWLTQIQRALRGAGASDVPCGTCTACCTSSQFVHIEPDELDALAHIPTALLFPAPRLPHGHVLMGYDEDGRCPMLGERGCSIYEHRPRTCRTYDCRIFPAAGVEVDDAQVAIGRRARRWRFEHPTARDRAQHDAVRAAAVHIRDHPDELPEGDAPANATQRAVLAIRLHDRFLPRDVDA
jgi:Fe-S-cluster containining protein